MTAVHYRGEAPMLQDVLGGRVACAFHSMTGSGDHIRAGRIRPLATLGRTGIPSMPQVPTFVSLGYPDYFGQGGFIGMFAPVRTPEPVLSVLVDAFTDVERVDARSSAPHDEDDYRAILSSAREVLTDRDRGLEQLYTIVIRGKVK